MESLKVMEKFDGGNFHLWKFKMRKWEPLRAEFVIGGALVHN
jgi:hypothetical protein